MTLMLWELGNLRGHCMNGCIFIWMLYGDWLRKINAKFLSMSWFILPCTTRVTFLTMKHCVASSWRFIGEIWWPQASFGSAPHCPTFATHMFLSQSYPTIPEKTITNFCCLAMTYWHNTEAKLGFGGGKIGDLGKEKSRFFVEIWN